MREAVRVRLKKEQLLELRELLGMLEPLRRRNLYPEAFRFLKEADEEFREFETEADALIEKARDEYVDSSEDISLDFDAAFSETDDGVHVQAWLWLPNESIADILHPVPKESKKKEKKHKKKKH